MQIEMERFFNIARRITAADKLTQPQVDGFNVLLSPDYTYIIEHSAFPKSQLAYIIATTWWETNHTMQPIEEIGRGRGHPYGERDPDTGQAYYGRGYVQLTWRKNYHRVSALTGVNVEQVPELAMQPKIAATILFRGMTEGWFTGRRLGDYITSDLVDFYNARRVVNGTDKAGTIAGLAATFREALG